MDNRIRLFGQGFSDIPLAELISASPEELEEAVFAIPITTETENPSEAVVETPTKSCDGCKGDCKCNKEKKHDSVVEDRVSEKIPNIDNLNNTISKCSNAIKMYMIKQNLYDEIHEYISDAKLLPDQFYQRVQNCVYHTMRDFCGLITTPEGTSEFKIPDAQSPYLPTIRFLNKLVENKSIMHPGDRISSNVIENYRRIYADEDGIQREWLSKLQERMQNKFQKNRNSTQVEFDGIKLICKCIGDAWCAQVKEDDHDSSETAHSVDFVTHQSSDGMVYKEPIFEHTFPEKDVEMEDDLKDCCEELEDSINPLEVIIDDSGIPDMVVISIVNNCDSPFEINCPFTVNLETLNREARECTVIPTDQRNDIWDWLIHVTRPIYLFRTTDPDKYFDLTESNQSLMMKVCVLDKTDTECIMGVYYVDSDIGLVEENNEGLAREVNYLASQYIAGTPISLRETVLATVEETPENEIPWDYLFPIAECDEETDPSEIAAQIMKEHHEEYLSEKEAEEIIHEIEDGLEEDLEEAANDEFSEEANVYADEVEDTDFVYKVRRKKEMDEF